MLPAVAELLRSTFTDPLVTGEVAYTVLTPDDWTPAERLPLILVLHGANSSSESLTMLQPITDRPRAVLACASTPTVGGFYLGAWETLVATAFPRRLAAEHGIATDDISLLGSSMGGYGALKIAFADPARWTAVAAVAPALLPADLRPRNTMDVLGSLAAEMTADGFAANSVVHRLRRHADAIRASALPIFLRCGDHDVFKMHDGTEELHRALWDLDIGHDYHLVYGADHLGPEATAAQRAALAFIAAAQRARAGTDRSAADRELETAWHTWAAGGREGPPPRLDALGPTGPAALRVMLAPLLAETERRDPAAARRYGPLAG
jgi:S-formylglutathione hydrolase